MERKVETINQKLKWQKKSWLKLKLKRGQQRNIMNNINNIIQEGRYKL